MVAVYSLNTFEINEKSYKTKFGSKRPDGISKNAFSSGHTAAAFMSTEFLCHEYKDASVWYGISGYFMAASTGFLRLYNDKHWLTDVVAGAGFGILSTKIAYWVYPLMKPLFFKEKQSLNALVLPFYDGSNFGLRFGMTF